MINRHFIPHSKTIFVSTSENRLSKFLSFLAKASFFIYLFFIFFGTSLPFQEKIKDIQEIGTSNPVNQILFSFLYVVSFISLIPKRYQLYQLIKAEKFLSFFLFWTFLSIFWSDFSFVSFKRWVQVFGMVVILVSALLHLDHADETLSFFKYIIILYISLSFLSVLFVPGAIDWRIPALRGLAPHKNILGQASLVSFFLMAYTTYYLPVKQKFIGFLFCGLSLVLLIGSKSFTSISTLFIITFLLGLFLIDKNIFRPLIGRLFSTIFLSFFLIGIIFIAFISQAYIELVLNFFGKDLTFTGRIDLWERMLDQWTNHLFIGSGFSGFWVMDSTIIETLYQEFIWLPNQAHMGYIDILNETGIIGFTVFLLMVTFYFINLFRVNERNLWKWFVFITVIINFTESTLFRFNSLTGTLFVFAYLTLYVRIIQKDNYNRQ